MSIEIQEQSANYNLADLKPVLENASSNDTLLDSLPIWLSAQTTKSAGRGRSPDNTRQYGVQKLRELILELALRGRLVEQDANDEPAIALIERIENDLEDLAKTSKSRKSKALPEVSPDEYPYKLPQGWVFIRNGKLFKLRKGKKPKNLTENEIGAPYLDVEALDRGNINRYTDDESCPKASSEDILVVCDGSRSGLVLDGMDGVIGSTLAVIQTPKWLQKYIKLIFSHGFRRWNTSMKGAAIPHLDTKNLVTEVTALPPLNEQHRIIKKVDDLMTLCDKLEQQQADAVQAHDTLVKVLLDTLTQSDNADEFQQNWRRIAEHFDTLFTTESSVDQLKQTVLQLAVMGKIVPQDPNDEPANVLLEKVAEEKARLVKQGIIKKQKPSRSLSPEETRFSIPDIWMWVRFSQTGYTRLGKMLDKAKNTGTLKKYLRNTNVQWWHIDLNDLKELKIEEHERDEYLVERGDLLICEGGEPGRCAVWDHENIEMYVQKAIHRHRPLGGCSADYLKFCLTVDASNGNLETLFTGATIKHLTGEKLASYTLPLPPVAEQLRIVKKVNKLMSLCDKMKDRISQAQTLQQQIANAVVENTVSKGA